MEETAVEETALPLNGILVLDFSQFLAGPVAAMRLADLGARVIKIERPETGDIGRTLAFAGRMADGDTVSFHAMNRNKESVAADLKDPADLAFVRELVQHADVILENFRPGVMRRLGLDYDSVRELNPRIVFASATGYGTTGPWAGRPGQDLLAQSLSGLTWVNSHDGATPTPVGLAIADHLLSCHIAHGVTALLLRRERTGRGGLVESSLLEGMLDLQFEYLSARLTDPTVAPSDRGPHSAHSYLPAPYGTYPTADGFLAIAMNALPKLGVLLELPLLCTIADAEQAWTRRTEIEHAIADRLRTQDTEHWLGVLDSADVWCAPVLDFDQLVESDGFRAIDMVQQVTRRGTQVSTTRSPLRIDGRVLRSDKPAPLLGEDTDAVRDEFTKGSR